MVHFWVQIIEKKQWEIIHNLSNDTTLNDLEVIVHRHFKKIRFFDIEYLTNETKMTVILQNDIIVNIER